MPIQTYQDLMAKRKSLKTSEYSSYFIAFNNLESNLDALNDIDESYLKEEIGKYKDALVEIRHAMDGGGNRVKCEEALKVMSGFKDFLLSGKGKNNYTRLIDDQELVDEKFPQAAMNPALVNKYLEQISDFFDLGIKVDELKAANEKLEKNPELDRRKINTEKVVNAEQLMALKSVGKNFLEQGCKEQKAVFKMQQELGGFLTNLEEKIEKDNKKDPVDQEIFEKFSKFYQATKTLTDAPNKVPLDTISINEALQTFAEMSSYLKEYNNDGKTNYMNFKQIAEKMDPKKVPLNNFSYGINMMDKVLCTGFDMDGIGRQRPYRMSTYTADKWIENYQKYYSDEKVKNADNRATYFASVMAARMLSDSVRGDQSTLKENIRNFEIEKHAAEIANTEEFKSFMKYLNENPKKMAEAEKAISRDKGHGGAFEDMFKEYLTNLPAGELGTSRILDRYMPRTIDRIDALKKQAEKLMKEGKTAEKQAAEILLLRDYAHAMRNTKETLYKKIPTGRDLKEEVKNLADEQYIKEMVAKDPETKTRLLKGHGGLLREHLANPKVIDAFVSKRENDGIAYTNTILQANYYPNRVEDNMTRAYELKETLQAALNTKNQDSRKIDALCNEAKNLIAEEIVLYLRNKQLGEDNEKQINWKNVDKAKNDLLENKDFIKTLLPKNSPKEYLEHLEEIGKGGDCLSEFVNKTAFEIQQKAGPEKAGKLMGAQLQIKQPSAPAL